MSTLTAYFQLLMQLRDNLAANLRYMGVDAADDEALQTLIPKVLQIAQGDTSQEVFLAELASEFDISYGFFAAGEVASLEGMCTISAMCRVSALRVTVSGSQVNTLTAVAPGWTISQGESLVLEYPGVTSRREAEQALEVIRFEGDGQTSVTGIVQVYAVGESGQLLPASGQAALRYEYGLSWSILESLGCTWGQIGSMSWTQLEQTSKLQGGTA